MAPDPQIAFPPGVIIIIDATGFIESILGQCTRVTGWRPRALVGKPLADTLIPAQYRQAHYAGMAEYRRSGAMPVRGQRLPLTALDPLGWERPIWLTVLGDDTGRGRIHALLEQRDE